MSAQASVAEPTCEGCGARCASGTHYCRRCGRALQADPRIGCVVDGRYRISRALGVGGMGVVYEAQHTRLDKRFAIKVIHSELAKVPEFAARFEREALSASRLKHPNCLEVSDFGGLPSGEPYLVMEYLDGRSLGGMVDSPQPLNLVLDIAEQLLRGLQHAHQKGIVHRDVKADNVMLVDLPDGGCLAKLVDFGLAKPLEGSGTEQITQFGMVLGTPSYMAPEQAAGEAVDTRADLYAVAALTWRMLVGRPLFVAKDPMQQLSLKLTRPAPRLEQVAPGVFPKQLDDLLARALQRDLERRLPSAEEFLAGLAQVPRRETVFEAGEPGAAEATSEAEITKRLPSAVRRMVVGVERGVASGCSAAAALGHRVANGWRWLAERGRGWYATGAAGGWAARVRALFNTADGRLVGALFAGGVAAVAVVLVVALGDGGLSHGPPNPLPLRSATVTPAEAQPTARAAKVGPDELADLPVELRERLRRTRTLLIAKSCRAAVREVGPALSQRPRLARAHYYHGAALLCLRRAKEGLAEYGRAIEIDGRYAHDGRILEDAEAVFRRRRSRMIALNFLCDRLGAAAVPLLLELAQHRSREVRTRAVAALTDLGETERIDRVRMLALDLEQTLKCEQRAQIVEGLRETDDPRAIAVLRRARDRRERVLGIFPGRHTHECVREEIIEAIKALQKNQDPI